MLADCNAIPIRTQPVWSKKSAERYPLNRMDLRRDQTITFVPRRWPAAAVAGSPGAGSVYTHELHLATLATSSGYCRWLDQREAATSDRVPADPSPGAPG